MTDTLKISVATLAIRRYPDVGAFRAHIEALAGEAAAEGSRLLLLPELACLGLLWGDPEAGATTVPGVAGLYRRRLTPLLGAYTDCLREVARRHRIAIAGASFWHEEKGHGLNSAYIALPDGTLLRQDKLHPTRPEQAIDTVGGETLTPFEIEGVRIGLAICYDVQFPELTRHLVAEGIEVLLVPSLTTERGYWRVRHSAQARAVENQIYVCVSPIVGDLGIPTDHPVVCVGCAYVACPIDNRFAIADGTYAEAAKNTESLLHVDLDLARLRLSRTKSEIRQLADRRPELYARLKR
ncbi:nitrilase-related carbon-nitrogen hydrolase [Hypericibacter adhaerens]|jgi:predicted amidohydrolase|nr:nitrilase-related carbon-nitrogen hydrolase [Hypericibacter adhaerens]